MKRYVDIFLDVCAVPKIVVFYSSVLECLRGMSFKAF
jgi:hypothetical protein